MLFENGQIEDAIAALSRGGPAGAGFGAAARRPGAGPDRERRPGRDREAARQLEEATAARADNAGAWRLLGIAQGRDGQQGLSDLAFAEYALLVGKRDDARLYARRAEGKIAASDPAWLRLQDILRVLEES